MTRRVLTALPVFNEERHLLEVLPQVRAHSQDVLVVDDGSSDRTPLLLAETDGIHVLRHETNQGYGAALRSAFQFAIDGGYDALVTIDCDGQHEPLLIPRLVERLYPEDGATVDIVSGSRYLEIFPGDSAPPEQRRRINAQITAELNRCFGLALTDTFCGFKAYRTSALRKFDITETGYAMPLQLWIQAVSQQMTIVEFPVPLIYLDETRSFGGSLDDAAQRLAYYHEVLQREMRLQQLGCGGGESRD
ncbi:MAG: glycosyltransferase family 2 protein [Planctomyces sp.]|nr:glycosyltransferase family 2 protein [Planctomyces sp.]